MHGGNISLHSKGLPFFADNSKLSRYYFVLLIFVTDSYLQVNVLYSNQQALIEHLYQICVLGTWVV